MRFISLEH